MLKTSRQVSLAHFHLAKLLFLSLKLKNVLISTSSFWLSNIFSLNMHTYSSVDKVQCLAVLDVKDESKCID